VITTKKEYERLLLKHILDGTEGFPVDRGDSVLTDRLDVFLCPIALVVAKAVLGKESVHFPHILIPGRLGDDRCGGDTDGKGIALDDVSLRDRELDRHRVDQQKVRCQR
jgi:hypothetical protein